MRALSYQVLTTALENLHAFITLRNTLTGVFVFVVRNRRRNFPRFHPHLTRVVLRFRPSHISMSVGSHSGKKKRKDETDSQDIDKRAFDQILSATNFPALTETKEKKNGTRENTPIVFIPGTFLARILARTLLSSLFGDGPTGIK